MNNTIFLSVLLRNTKMKVMKNLFAVVLFAMIFAASCDNDAGFLGTSDEGAISGKYKTMLVVDNFMYAVNDSELISFDIKDGDSRCNTM